MNLVFVAFIKKLEVVHVMIGGPDVMKSILKMTLLLPKLGHKLLNKNKQMQVVHAMVGGPIAS